MSVTEITLRIRRAAASPVLELVDPENGGVLQENLPADLKLPTHQGDYKTYRDTFVKVRDENSEFSEIGRHLFALLHVGEVGRRLEELKLHRKADERFRVLLDIEPAGQDNLALLPWELIFNGALRPFQLFDDSIVRIVKYGPAAAPGIELINWPIRLLIVKGVPDPAIDIDPEVEKIEDGLRAVDRLVDVEVLEYPDINKLETKCKEFRPHIFHYIGHGGATNTGDAFILLRRPGGGANAPWTASQIQTSLKAWDWIPRFAFINACRTAGRQNATIDDQINAWGIADAFHGLEVPAVLTMQADIKGSLAGEFAGAIYERLGEGKPIDRAVALARVRLRDNTNAVNKDLKRDWATPTLTVSIPPRQILPMKPKASEELQDDIKKCERFDEVSILANCREDRRKFIHGFYPIPKCDPKDLIIVRGPKGSGKTWITLWCLAACALQNHDVRYVEVVSHKSPKWLDVLTQIQNGDSSKAIAGKYQLIYKPLSPEAFYEFNHQLRYRIKNETPPEWNTKPVLYQDLDLSELDNLPENTVKDIFTSFRNALINAAQPNNDLIIVLDQFTYKQGRISAGHREYLRKFLFEYAAAGRLKSADETCKVKFVLVLSDDELKNTYPELNKLKPYWHEVLLEGIPAQDYEKVMREFFRIVRTAPQMQRLAKTIVDDNEVDTWIRKFSLKCTDPWLPSLLGRVRGFLESFAD
jgi:hypothetical protein